MSKAAAIAFLSIGELLAFCPHGVHQLSGTDGVMEHSQQVLWCLMVVRPLLA
jgi:hypothetical protein